MRNLSKKIILLSPFILSHGVWAGQAVIFDRPELISFDDRGKLSGYYNSSDNRRSCTFLFSQVGRELKGSPQPPYSQAEIFTFVPKGDDFKFSNRERSFDMKGQVYRRDDTWIIRTNEGQAGCENGLGAFVSPPADKVGGEMFSVTKRISAIGVRLVNRKSFFYDLQSGKFVARKGYLLKWNGVIVLRVHGRFSYVRYSESNPPSSDRVTTGWVRSIDLVNPFPPRNKP